MTDVLLNHFYRNATVSGYLGIGHAMNPAEQEHLLALGWQVRNGLVQHFQILRGGDFAFRRGAARVKIQIIHGTVIRGMSYLL